MSVTDTEILSSRILAWPQYLTIIALLEAAGGLSVVAAQNPLGHRLVPHPPGRHLQGIDPHTIQLVPEHHIPIK